jgi:hypothetical protein
MMMKERPMQVMLLIHADENAWPRMPEAERDAAMAAYGAYTAALREAGALVSANRLAPTAASHTVRMVDGAPQVLDGPYAETREQLGGYYLIEVPDMGTALRWAARCPGAGHGVVEARPVMG